MQINGGSITDNTATAYGGGIYGKNVTIGENNQGVYTGTGVVSNNTAAHPATNLTRGNGGGIYINYGTLDINAGNIFENNAEVYGGGVYVISGSMTMNTGAIKDNTASSNTASGKGGGVYIDNCTSMTMNGGEIYGNYAKINGGGVLLKATPTSITFISPASLDNIHDNYKGSNILSNVVYET